MYVLWASSEDNIHSMANASGHKLVGVKVWLPKLLATIQLLVERQTPFIPWYNEYWTKALCLSYLNLDGDTKSAAIWNF